MAHLGYTLLEPLYRYPEFPEQRTHFLPISSCSSISSGHYPANLSFLSNISTMNLLVFHSKESSLFFSRKQFFAFYFSTLIRGLIDRPLPQDRHFDSRAKIFCRFLRTSINVRSNVFSLLGYIAFYHPLSKWNFWESLLQV